MLENFGIKMPPGENAINPPSSSQAVAYKLENVSVIEFLC
jgi:hypothetical protein